MKNLFEQSDIQFSNEELIKGRNITVLEAIKGFSNYLYIEGKAKSTAEAYLSDIRQFNTFLKIILSDKIRYANHITKVELVQYKSHLLEKMKRCEFGKKTVERKYNAVKVFFRFLNSCYGIENITKGDNFGNKNSVRDWNDNYETNGVTPIISTDEIDKLFSTLYNSNDKNMFRDIAIMELLIGIGCRKSELLHFKWNDINFYDNEISIRRKKTKNIDVVKLNQKSLNSLVVLRNLCSSLYSDSYIFKGRDSEELSPSALHAIVKKWVNKSGINSEISPHYFRHTFITSCIKEGISNEIIIKYTGHSDVKGLNPYIHLVANDTIGVANVMDKVRGA